MAVSDTAAGPPQDVIFDNHKPQTLHEDVIEGKFGVSSAPVWSISGAPWWRGLQTSSRPALGKKKQKRRPAAAKGQRLKLAKNGDWIIEQATRTFPARWEFNRSRAVDPAFC